MKFHKFPDPRVLDLPLQISSVSASSFKDHYIKLLPRGAIKRTAKNTSYSLIVPELFSKRSPNDSTIREFPCGKARSQRFNICAHFGFAFIGARSISGDRNHRGDLGFHHVAREGFRGGKRPLNPDASTTIYIFVSLSEMPCSRLYIPIPAFRFFHWRANARINLPRNMQTWINLRELVYARFCALRDTVKFVSLSETGIY